MNQILSLAREFYFKIPLSLRWIGSPFRICLEQLRQLRLDFWIVEGVEINSGMPLSILFAARGKNTNYLLELIYGSTYKKCNLGCTWLWDIPKMIERVRSRCSMVLFEVSNSHLNLLRKGNSFNIPSYIIGEVDIPLDPTIFKNKTIKNDLRKIQKNSLEFEIVADQQYFFEFYHKMYIPYVSKIYPTTMTVPPFESKFYENRELLLIKKQGKCIAGATISYDGNSPKIAYMGILDGDLEYLRDGSIGALFYYSFTYLENKGFSKVDLGMTRPFLRDGVLRSKKKWSQRITGIMPTSFALEVQRDTVATRAFLVNNPFIFERKGLLYGAIFMDSEEPLSREEIEQVDKNYFLPGLSKLFIYYLRPGLAAKKDAVPQALSEHIVPCSADCAFSRT